MLYGAGERPGSEITDVMATKGVKEDQNKRALDALERRFAVAKAEVHHQVREKRRRENPSVVKASPASVQNTSLKKDLEEETLTYSDICQPVHENLLTGGEILDRDKGTVDKILHELLQKGDSAQKYIQGSRSIKMDNWILLDNFVQGSNTSVSRMRALRANSKRSKKHMSIKQLKECGLLRLPQEQHKFELYMPMHEMWKTYVIQLLKNIGKNQGAQSLLVADLHGAILRVVDCKVESFIGVFGIMIRETAETFE
ncbi:Ribonuclease P protein subunit p29 [Bienertia sinuspersici]